jgi:hypothetical protein
MSENGRRKRGDDALAVALAAGKTLRDAAAVAGVAERTATRRWADPGFRIHVAELRADMMARAWADRRRHDRACYALLEMGVKLHESLELEERIADLERRV